MSTRFRFLIAFCLCGLLINCLLVYWRFMDPSGTLAGCGGAAACEEVLSSRWSQVFGIPVVALGILAYVVLYAALLWERKDVAAVCYMSIFGSAIWLVFVQAAILREICPWCMAAHSVGVTVVLLGLLETPWDHRFKLGLLTGLATAFVLAIGQLYGPVPPQHVVAPIPHVNRGGFLPEDIHAVGTGPKISFNDGGKIFDCEALPHLGSAEATHVLVEYFDYQCKACHKMRDYLSALVDKYPKDVCVIVLPVPLDHGCNPSLPTSEAGHPGSCDLTRIALAVWLTRPESFATIHQQFMSDPPMDRATALAFAHREVKASELDPVLKDLWIDRLIKANITDWTALSRDTSKLPKLMISDKRILHGLPSGRAEFIQVMEKELNLPAAR